MHLNYEWIELPIFFAEGYFNRTMSTVQKLEQVFLTLPLLKAEGMQA